MGVARAGHAAVLLPSDDPAHPIVVMSGGFSSSAITGRTVEQFSLADSIGLTASSLPNAGVAEGYIQQLVATGGVGPYTFVVVAGELPAGLSLNAGTGEITGVSQTVGTSTVIVKITDSAVPAHIGYAELTIRSTSSLTLSGTFTEGRVDQPYELQLQWWAAGPSPVTDWQIEPGFGSIPPGLSLNPSNGTLFGTPSAGGHFSFLVRATDSGAPQQTVTRRMRVNISQVDQRQIDESTANVPFGSSSGLGQIVTVGATGMLTGVRIPVYCTDGFVGVSIRNAVPSGATFEPGLSVIASSYSLSPIGTETSWTSFDIPIRQQPFVRAGQRFAIVVTTSPTASCYVNAGAAGDTYGGGDLFSSTNPWENPWSPVGSDLAFEAVVAPVRLANYGTATADGAIAAGEWASAGVVNFYTVDNDGDVPATALVMNDATNVHLAVVRETFLAPGMSNFFLNVNADNNNDGVAYQTGEDLWALGGDGLAPAWMSDAVGSNASCPGSPSACEYPADTSVGGVQNGSGALARTDDEATFEVTHPFNSGDAKDIALPVGQTFGLNLNMGVNPAPWSYYSQFPQSPTAMPVTVVSDPETLPPASSVTISGSQATPGEWIYNLSFAPLVNYSIFQPATTITVSGLCGVTAAGIIGPTHCQP